MTTPTIDQKSATQGSGTRKNNRGANLGGLTPAEIRERGKASAADRLTRLEAQVPPRTMSLVRNVPAAYQARLVRANVGECRSFACALWRHRPYQPKPVETGENRG